MRRIREDSLKRKKEPDEEDEEEQQEDKLCAYVRLTVRQHFITQHNSFLAAARDR